MEKFIDTRDGKEYKTVRIGNLLWMAENLAYEGVDHSLPSSDDDDNDNSNGLLYTWESAKRACPAGWRLPTREDLNQLIDSAEKVKDFFNQYAGKVSTYNTIEFGFGSFWSSSFLFQNPVIFHEVWSCRYTLNDKPRLYIEVSNAKLAVRCIKD